MGKDIGLTAGEIQNSRFYGVARVRGRQLDDLGQDINAKTGYTWNGGNQTVDLLNYKLGITNDMFYKNLTLGMVRANVKNAIDAAPFAPDLEVQAWGEWLREPSRWDALMMYEMTGEECRRARGLDRDIVEQRPYVDTRADRNFQIAQIDNQRRIIYRGDKNRNDRNSHWINSGKTITYTIYWMQEGCGTDDMRTPNNQSYIWTDTMRDAHDKVINADNNSTVYQNWNNFIREAEKSNLFDNVTGPLFLNKVDDETMNWHHISAQSRFFRLTSLMGMDFFVNRGNTVRFSRNANQINYDESPVNRVITDSEWAHAEEMGYLAEGRVIRHDNDDRFRLRQ